MKKRWIHLAHASPSHHHGYTSGRITGAPYHMREGWGAGGMPLIWIYVHTLSDSL